MLKCSFCDEPLPENMEPEDAVREHIKTCESEEARLYRRTVDEENGWFTEKWVNGIYHPTDCYGECEFCKRRNRCAGSGLVTEE